MTPNSKRRWRLMKGQRGRCFYCREYMTMEADQPNTVTIDHLIPRSQGGNGKAANLVGACQECNQDKADTDINEYADTLDQSALKARRPS